MKGCCFLFQKINRHSFFKTPAHFLPLTKTQKRFSPQQIVFPFSKKGENFFFQKQNRSAFGELVFSFLFLNPPNRSFRFSKIQTLVKKKTTCSYLSSWCFFSFLKNEKKRFWKPKIIFQKRKQKVCSPVFSRHHHHDKNKCLPKFFKNPIQTKEVFFFQKQNPSFSNKKKHDAALTSLFLVDQGGNHQQPSSSSPFLSISLLHFFTAYICALKQNFFEHGEVMRQKKHYFQLLWWVFQNTNINCHLHSAEANRHYHFQPNACQIHANNRKIKLHQKQQEALANASPRERHAPFIFSAIFSKTIFIIFFL